MSNTNGFFDPSPSEASISGNEVTINPGQDFDYSSDYYILTSSNLLYTTGTGNSYYAGINDSTTLNFTTVAAPDLTAPTLDSSAPADDASAVAIDSDIVLTFSETVVAGAGNIIIKKSVDDSTVATIPVTDGQVSISGDTVTINPTADLENSTDYYIVIDADALDDAADNAYAGISDNSTLNFTTAAAPTAPAPAASAPSDDSTAIASPSNSVSSSADPLSVSASTSQGTKTPAATVVSTDNVVTDSARSELSTQQVSLNSQAIDFEVETGDESPTATANIPLTALLGDLTLITGDGKRDPSINPIYYAIDDQGALSPLSYDPLLNAGARFYDTDGDGIADFLSLKLIDGGFGDKDGVKNGVIDDPSAMGTVALDPVITALENGFLQVADAANAAPAAIALQASLTSRANAVTEIGYVILNEGEEASTVSDLTAFQERASRLFSALENKDVTLTEAMTFNSQFLLRNGQSIRFFAVTNGSLADLASLEDSRFSFLDGSVDATTGAASFSSASGIGFDLELLNSDQTLGALIAQEQHDTPLLDFTAFTNDETITGTIIQAREADYDAVTGFYRVLDTSGSVRAANGSLLTPSDDGYAAAALLEANRISAFDNLSIADGESSSTEFSLKEASTIAPFAKVKGNTFFAFADANTDGLSHFRSLGSNLFGLEDQLGGGDLDYDDHIVGFSIGGLTPATPAVA